MAKKAKKTKKVAPAKKAAKAAVKKSVKKSAKKAFGLLSVAPGFTANDAAVSVKWYCDVLGFKISEKWESDGQFQGAAVSLGKVTINIGQDDWKMGRDRAKGQASRMYITTGPGIDAYARQVVKRGGVLDQPVTEGWGYRMFGITDPDGFKLTFMAKI